MFNLFKKDKKYPPFETLQCFEEKDKYFVRTAQWRRLNKQSITVTDPLGPRMLTMGRWPQIVFLESDGQKTVTELVYHMAGAYSGQIPPNKPQKQNPKNWRNAVVEIYYQFVAFNVNFQIFRRPLYRLHANVRLLGLKYIRSF
jgi:hypothetical protein